MWNSLFFAYIDPGAGTILMQLLFSGVVTFLFFFRSRLACIGHLLFRQSRSHLGSGAPPETLQADGLGKKEAAPEEIHHGG